jgi:hypothetical protein
MAGKTGRKLAKVYYSLMELCAIVYLITQLEKKKLKKKYTIILVVVLLLVVITNPIIPFARHPVARILLLGVPALILGIVWATMAL